MSLTPPTVENFLARTSAAAEAQKRKVEAAKADAQWVMGDARGRRFVARLLADAGVYRTTFADSPHTSAFNEGRRNGGLSLLSTITEAGPDEYLLMEKERINGSA